MRSREFLIERILNLWTPEERQPYAKQVWDMLLRSYKHKGGFKSASSLEELVNTPGYWKLTRRGDKITSVSIYKKVEHTNNFKGIASASETEFSQPKNRYAATKPGYADYSHMKDADLKTHRSWSEVSAEIEQLLLKSGAKSIPNKFAAILTGKEILKLNPDGIHYTRLIKGEPHEKSIYGFVSLSPSGQAALERSGISLHDLPDNVAARA